MRPIRIFCLVVLVAITFSACKKESHTKPAPKGIELSLTSTELQKVSSDNSFTFDLFKTVAAGNTNGRNLFLSPLSVSMAVGMTGNGANGQTLDAIRTAMDFTNYTQDEVNSYYNKLITQLPQLDPNTTLKIANSIWYGQGFNVLPQFITTDSNYYHARIQSLDFTKPASVNTINDWVKDQTNGKISKMLNSIDAGSVMYLINAIYFKSTWLNKFDPAQTQKMPFHLADGTSVQADFMQGHVAYNFYSDNDATMVELPYANSKYSMVMIMPKNGSSVNDIISSLGNTAWQSRMSKLLPTTNELVIPKFQFSYDIDLKEALTTLGMGNAFSDEADFTRINPQGGLKISQVKHKAFVAVDENGTEAAAATSVGIIATAYMGITIDRPFVFVIREMKTGLILFAGTVNNPLQNGL